MEPSEEASDSFLPVRNKNDDEFNHTDVSKDDITINIEHTTKVSTESKQGRFYYHQNITLNTVHQVHYFNRHKRSTKMLMSVQ